MPEIHNTGSGLVEVHKPVNELSDDELTKLEQRIRHERERRKFPERIKQIKEHLADAKILIEDVGVDYQYGGPFMPSHSHGELSSQIGKLASDVQYLLRLLDEV